MSLLLSAVETVQTAGLTDLINNLGFPIAMVCYFIYDKKANEKKQLDTINGLASVIANNNKILTVICTKLDMEVVENETK